MVALIPARAGSKRIPHKNTRRLAGQPLIAYTIAAAKESGRFRRIVVCSDDGVLRFIAQDMGVEFFERQPVPDDEADIVWVRRALRPYVGMELTSGCESFAILRPTSPFRTAGTIKRAFERFDRMRDVHSMRAVEPVKQHPGKCWYWTGPGYPMQPVLHELGSDGTPWHSMPTQELRRVYVQNASLEMAWSYVPLELGTISGTKVLPFFTDGYEGFDLNTEADWREAERLITVGAVDLPAVSLARV